MKYVSVIALLVSAIVHLLPVPGVTGTAGLRHTERAVSAVWADAPNDAPREVIQENVSARTQPKVLLP